MLKQWLVVVALGLGLLVACGPAAPTQTKAKLVLAIQPTLATTEMVAKAKPIEQFLEQKLGDVDVEIYVPMSQAGVIESLRFGQAHIAFMSAWPAQLAVDLSGAELALAEVREVLIDGKKTEQTFYFSYWVVPTSSPYKSLTDLKGKRACFTSPISTSGYVSPVGRMLELGLIPKPDKNEADPKAFFGNVIFGGGYQQCWEALKGGQTDVSIIAGDVPEKLYNEVLANTRVLEQQGPIPSHGVVVSKELKDPLRKRAIDAITALGEPAQRELMRGFISSIFVGFKATNAEAHLGTLRNYLKQAGLTYTERIGK
jgi:phosphonate transport system substrate-binding protein